MKKTAVVTGAGSGVGRAVAVALSNSRGEWRASPDADRRGRAWEPAQGSHDDDDWRVALVGRRAEALTETAKLCGGQALCCPCDVSDAAAVNAMAARVLDEFGAVEVLVNAAGTNLKQRRLADISLADYRTMIDTNLHGAFHCTQAFLPQMRARGSGTIVNIGSEAGKQANPGSGPGYIVGKFALTGLNQAINAEERGHGIRACIIQPGEIDTAILDQRPQPPDAQARAMMLQPEDVAACVLLCINLPARAIVEEILVRPR